MRWAIVGGGTAGPAAALFLARAGHEVVLFERVAKPEPVGAGILLQPTGMAVLRRLGLLQTVLGRGARIASLEGYTDYGRKILDLRYADLRSDLFGLGIHRGALFSALWQAVCAESRIERRTGVEITAPREGESSVIVGGETFDRAAIASGARSELRPPGARARPYPWGALWFVGRADPHPGVLFQRYRDTRKMAGLLPSGDGTVSVFWSLRADALPAWKAAGIDAWKAEVSRLMPEAPVHAVEGPDDVVFAPYFDVVAPRWNTRRIAFLGDSAHAMSPQLGQGANLALQDAAALADCADGPLDRYSELRRGQLGFYSFASRFLTPFFQSSLPILAPPRDLAAPWFHAWPWYRRQMLAVLAGVKTGIFEAMPVPE